MVFIQSARRRGFGWAAASLRVPQNICEGLGADCRGLGETAHKPDRSRHDREQRKVGETEHIRAFRKSREVRQLRPGMFRSRRFILYRLPLNGDPCHTLRRHSGASRSCYQQAYLRARQHVLCMRRELTDMDNKRESPKAVAKGTIDTYGWPLWSVPRAASSCVRMMSRSIFACSIFIGRV